MIGTVPFLMQTHQEPHDYNRYTKVQLENLLCAEGFFDVHVVPIGCLIDVYETIELKFFTNITGVLGKLFRALRRFEMRMMRHFLGTIPATHRLTEGFGFTARRG